MKKIEISRLLTKLRGFVEKSCEEDRGREILSRAEFEALLVKHFRGLNFAPTELGSTDFGTVADCASDRLIKVAVQRHYPKNNIELHFSSGKLLIRYLPLKKLTMEGWGYGTDSLPEPCAEQCRDFMAEIKSKAGPQVEFTLPEAVWTLQIPCLGHVSFGFESEIKILSEAVALLNKPLHAGDDLNVVLSTVA